MNSIVTSRDPKGPHAVGIFAAEVRVHRIADMVERIIQLGQHRASGMSAEEYRALWPETVEQPSEYVGRLDIPLLVDRTIPAEKLGKCNCDVKWWVRHDQCEDIVPAPVHPENGKPLTRYVAWVQLGRYLNRRVEDVRGELPEDEVGLVSAEGLHLPGQQEKHLRQYVVDIAGSRFGLDDAPCVRWFDSARPYFGTLDVRDRGPVYGSGSRGKKLVPVSWKA